MTACEECWNQAYILSRTGPMSQVEAYEVLIKDASHLMEEAKDD